MTLIWDARIVGSLFKYKCHPELDSGSKSLSNKSAFTLAEVLITLGIIGVVAAMTIPNLIANVRAHQNRSAFKKGLSTINQAVRLNEANYGYNFASVYQNCSSYGKGHPETEWSVCSIFNGSLSGYTVSDDTYLYSKRSKNLLYYKDLFYTSPTPDTLLKEVGTYLYYYQMNDGMMIGFHDIGGPLTSGWQHEAKCTLDGTTLEQAIKDSQFQKFCIGFIDVNGPSLPNREVRCSDGKSHSVDITASCTVPNSVNYMGDVIPVVFYDSTVAAGSAAARYVLSTSK
ncbi:type II secretion system protein [bacterium]|nr:type II secretion system protein [bacterium]